jgi:AraC-like DNA-binding protein
MSFLYIYNSKNKSKSIISKLAYKVDCELISKNTFDTINPTYELVIIDLEYYIIELFLTEIIQLKKPIIFLLSEFNEEQYRLLNKLNSTILKIKPINISDLQSAIFLLIQEDEALISNIPKQIQAVIDYIENNIKEKIQISSLAEMTSWDYAHFIKVFKRHVGKTPHQYILKEKVKCAKELLTSRKINLQDVALEVGFESYSNFVNAFKKETNQLPFSFKLQNATAKN